ncbi:outer membrane protein [Dysgonomonas sp. PFB1-18]|uniref:TolC family protein n=1 Tax=unclassified Dysgonomonas TaxID=2630389 RepID=UPI0024749843|nr:MULTISPECIES: TolC family protein [unclassified Dysgonomonas]MDH6308748.1 outer membrane protein [Dysgonomonas sp. PF1-14]MDH6338555.1 outer membrane protein [Dysgonomonas sp. PF1-16]MDH6379997.1 outer membrane protein [Dysgonomonas sp. PFB1-18]MDH6397383.1 outer membrane protein [Dysgonomonas sp. PF1-23]
MNTFFIKRLFGLVFSVAGLIIPATAFSQNAWTLKDCIDYARRENIQVKRSNISAESYNIDISQSKAELFPSLSGSVSARYTNSQSPSEKGDYRYEGLFNGQYTLNANWTIYNGGKNRNNIKQAQLQKEAQDLYTEYNQNEIEIAITQAYLQILYSRESIKNNENIVASSAEQLKQTQDFLDAGSITRSEYAQVEAQYSSDKYNLVQAQNSYDNYMLQLKQLLELDYNADIDIVFPVITDEQVLVFIPSKYEVYRRALAIMPEIQSSKLNMQIANLTKSSAKAGYLPTVSLTGSIGTGNIFNSSPSFATQIGRNFNQSVGVTVSIPIFDNKQNRSNVKKAELQVQTAELDYLDTQKTLQRTVESLYQDAVAGQSKYNAAKDKLNSAKLSYELVQEQYSLGMRNTVELTTEKNNYANALQDMLQAKYTALVSVKLLNFYQGQEITL